MWRLLGFCLATLHLLPALAIHASEAGVVDWYKPLIGDTLTGNANLLPVFHRIGERDTPTRSLVLTATASNVLAALYPENGTIAWRHLFDDDDRILAFKKHKTLVATLSGTGGAIARVFDVANGDLLHERHLHKAEAGRLLEPDDTGIALAFDTAANIYALTNGHIVRKIDANTGEVVWGWTAPDQTSLNIYSAVLPTPSAVYLIGLAKSFASYTLHITALSPTDGTVLASADIPSSIEAGPASILLLHRLSNETELARAVWVEDKQIKSVALTPQLADKKPATLKGAAYHGLVNIGLGEHGLLVARKDDGAGRVLRLNEAGTGLDVIWEYADSAQSPQNSPSMYSGGVDKDGYPYIARVFWSHFYKKASAHVLAPHLADGKGLVTGYTFPFETAQHGIIGHVALDAANPEELRVVARLALSTTTGALQLWQHDALQWAREEGLAEIQAAEPVALPERRLAAPAAPAAQPFAARLRRQLAQARGFPRYAAHFARRFVTGAYDSVSAAAAPAGDELVRDAFGLRKVLVVATARGKVYGLDSASGAVLWGRVFGLGWAAEVGGRVHVAKILTVRDVGEGEAPQVVVVTQRRANNGLIDTVVFHVDALTGEDATGASQPGDVLKGTDVIAGQLVEAYLVKDDSTRFVLLFDEFLQAHIYPDTAATAASFTKLLPSLHFALRTGAPGALRLTGHRIAAEKEFTGRHVAYATWTGALPAGEDVVRVLPRPRARVASLGKVLGNRTTLYKYLSPHAAAVQTAALAGPRPHCGLYVVDVVTGATLYHAVLPAARGACDVHAVFDENWLVYHYYDPEPGADGAKGWRVVSVELYEGAGVDDKTRSADISAFANASTAVTVFEQSYVFPRAVTAMTTTATKFGITSKDLIVATEDGRIQAFPRRFLDPRRPPRKPTAEELEEWLAQYDALVPDDAKRVLAHAHRVARVRGLVCTPAALESTALLFAHGLDLFGARAAPSGTFDVLSDAFNKAQLVLTGAGLALAILVTRPMVRRKRVRERWYS